MIKAPYYISTQVFPSDGGFSWRIKVWLGDVDVLHAPPSRVEESKKASKTEATATRAALAAYTKIVTSPSLVAR